MSEENEGSLVLQNGEKVSPEEIMMMRERYEHRGPFRVVYKEYKNGKTWQEMKDEVLQKKSKLSRSARDFLLEYPEEEFNKWVADIE